MGSQDWAVDLCRHTLLFTNIQQDDLALHEDVDVVGAPAGHAPDVFCSPAVPLHRKETNNSDLLPRLNSVSRTIDGISLTTVGAIILGLILLDLVGTVIFAAAFSGRSRQGYFSDWELPNFGGLVSNVYNSIDIVDTTFNYMDIDSDHCRLRTVCEMESYAANNPIARLAINTVNSNLRGLEKYSEAVEAGLARQDCALLYDQCQTSYFGF